MCCSSQNSCSGITMKEAKQFQLEPRMLKDFLSDDFGSCSSGGFKSFSRTVDSDSCLTNKISENFGYGSSYDSRNSKKVPRSRSMSAFQAVINAVKSIHFSIDKSPSIVPRSLSRRHSKRRLQRGNTEMIKTRVITVKDIIRWRSFRDIVDEKQEQSPQFEYTITTTATVSTATTPSSSNASSWCDSDFTSEYLPEEYTDTDGGKKYLPHVGGDLIEAIKNYKDHDSKVNEDKQLQSPVSVIDLEQYISTSSEEDDDEEEEDEDEDEKKVWRLLNHLKTTSRLSYANELLLLDFLRYELGSNKDNIKNGHNFEFYGSILDRAEGWIKGESSSWVGLKEKYYKGTYLEKMNKGGTWNNFGEEEEELVWGIECDVVEALVDEVLLDLISS